MTIVFLGLALMLFLMALGVPLAVAMLSVGIVGLSFVHSGGLSAAIGLGAQEASDFITGSNFAVLPLFILMGVFITRAEISDELYEVFRKWIGHFKGGLAMATVGACSGFAAVSGSSLATAVTMAKVAVPTMRRHNYQDWFSSGSVAAGGTLGILIPPSPVLIIFGILAEVDIGMLFVGALIPGILTVVVYIVVIKTVVALRPEAGPVSDHTSWVERLTSLYKMWAILAMFVIIMGGIFFGLFTASEAGSVGAAGAFLFAVMKGKMSWTVFRDSLIEAAVTSATVFSVAIGALVFNQFVNLSGFPELLSNFITSTSGSIGVVIAIILVIYILLGMFIDGPAMVFLTVPIFVPVLLKLDPNFNLIWWGIVTVMVVEISLITPPVGLNVFVINSMLPDVPIVKIYKGIAPYFIGDLVRLAIVVLFPALVMWLPALMG